MSIGNLLERVARGDQVSNSRLGQDVLAVLESLPPHIGGKFVDAEERKLNAMAQPLEAGVGCVPVFSTARASPVCS